MKSFDLIENMPIYARFLDEHGLLEHISNAVQPQLDAIIRDLDLRDAFFNPQLCPPRFLPFLAQFWGLANEGDHWQGIGLNPAWSDAHTRNVITRIPVYWVKKGTDWGIREAIALWLQWEAAHTHRLDIRLPFGDTPTANLPQWWDYSTRYDAFLNQPWRERQQYGSGDYFQSGRPWFEILEGAAVNIQDDHELWSSRLLKQVDPPIVNAVGSALGPERPWMHFDLYEIEWATVVPDIVQLNPEIWSSFAEPEVFAWLGYRLRSPLTLTPSDDGGHFALEEHLFYDGFKYYDWWYYEAGDPVEVTETVIVTELFGLAPGHGYPDVWNSPYFATPWDYLYYVPTAERTVTIEETTLEYRSCHPGFLAALETGSKDEYINSRPAISPTQLLERFDPFDISIDMGGLSIDDNRADPHIETARIDVGGITIDWEDTVVWEYDISIATREIKKQYQYLPRIEIETFTLSSEPVYLLKKPWQIMLYRDIWETGWEYYYPGEMAYQGELTTLPVFTNHRICNLVDHYSMRLIERFVVRVPLPMTEIDIFEAYPLLRQVSNGENWRLVVETTSDIYLLKPVTLFWSERFGAGNYAQRSQFIDLESKPKFLYLEFMFQPLNDGFITGTSLLLQQTCIQSHTPITPLAITPNVTVGVKIIVPFQLESGAQTFAEDQAIAEYLPSLWQDMVEIKYVANKLFMPDYIEIPESDTPPDNTLRTMLEQAHQQMIAIRDDLAKIVTVKKDIFPIILGDGQITSQDGIYTIIYEVSTGLGDQNFGVGQFQYAEGSRSDVERPVVERSGEDSIKVTLKSAELIPDGTFAIWVYQSTRPEEYPVTIDVSPV